MFDKQHGVSQSQAARKFNTVQSHISATLRDKTDSQLYSRTEYKIECLEQNLCVDNSIAILRIVTGSWTTSHILRLRIQR